MDSNSKATESGHKEYSLRFAVTDGNGLRAATWKVWTPKNKSDVYLTCREWKTDIKISMHASGRWHTKYSQAAIEKYFEVDGDPTQPKYIEQWFCPKPIAEGVTIACRIVTPASSVTARAEPEENSFIWIPNCSETKATEIDLFILDGPHEEGSWVAKDSMNTIQIGCYPLSNGKWVSIIYMEVDLPDFTSLKKTPMNLVKGLRKKDVANMSLRGAVFAILPDGSRVIHDVVINNNVAT